MNLKKLIVHQIVKEKGMPAPKTTYSEHLLPNDEASNKLVYELVKSFSNDKTLNAKFDKSPGKYFPEKFEQYQQSDKKDETYITFTKNLVGNLETLLGSKPAAKGGYIVCIEYEYFSKNLFSLFLIRDTEGLIFKRKSADFIIDSIEYLNTKDLAMACRINVDGYSADNINYLSFTSHKQNDISGYFSDWISTLQFNTNKEFTDTLYKIINDLKPPINPDTKELYEVDEVKKMVHAMAKANPQKEINIRTLSEEIYGQADLISKHVEENSIIIDTVFQFDGNALRRFVKVHIKADGIDIRFGREQLDNKITVSKDSDDVVFIESKEFADAIRKEQNLVNEQNLTDE